MRKFFAPGLSFLSLIFLAFGSTAAEYHNWLTPQQIGARFGLAHEDLEVIQKWLESPGFSVNRVHVNGLVIDFSGSAAEVRDAFHTEIHHLVLPSGEHHIANIRDPEVPADLATGLGCIDATNLFNAWPHPR